jgi:hypothetical protein
MGDCGGRARYRGSLHPLGPYRFGFKTDAIPPVSGSFEILPKFVLYPKVLVVIRRKRVMETLVAYTNLSETKTPQVCPILGLDGHVLQVKSPAYASIGSGQDRDRRHDVAGGSQLLPTGPGWLRGVDPSGSGSA